MESTGGPPPATYGDEYHPGDHGALFKNCVESPPGSGLYKLPVKTKLLYAWPGFAYYAMRYLRSTQMKKFYTDHVGVPLWWIAIVVSVAVSVDALSDPIVGFWSDSVRWNIRGEPMRRRPFIAVGSVLLSVLYLLLWSPCLGGGCDDSQPSICVDQSSVGGAAFFFLVVYVLYYMVMGTVLIPYEALGAELSPNHEDRSNLMATYFSGMRSVWRLCGWRALGPHITPSPPHPSPQAQCSMAVQLTLSVLSCDPRNSGGRVGALNGL
jgi:MFS family permease